MEEIVPFNFNKCVFEFIKISSQGRTPFVFATSCARMLDYANPWTAIQRWCKNVVPAGEIMDFKGAYAGQRPPYLQPTTNIMPISDLF